VFANLPHGPRDFSRSLPLGVYHSIRDRLAAGPVQGDPSIAPCAYVPSTLANYFASSVTTWI
jgi:hypothetical protein